MREMIRLFKPDGGFVFNQVHNIMGNVPPENMVAMLDTAYEESWYKRCGCGGGFINAAYDCRYRLAAATGVY